MTEEAAVPVVVLAECRGCKSVFRAEIPVDVVARFGPRLRGAFAYAMQAAHIKIPVCECRDLRGRKIVTVNAEYKPDVQCGNSCWQAKSAGCVCSCKGLNHGKAHAFAESLVAGKMEG
jgi:hypothetical protein